MVNGMVAFDGNRHLDSLYQKSLSYQNHRENYLTSLLETLIPSGLKINKRPALNQSRMDLRINGSPFSMTLRKV